jgi:methyl-accepting chemotaxis protein
MVLDKEGNFLYHPDASLNGKNVKDHAFAKQLFATKEKSGHLVFKEGKVEQDIYYQSNEKGNFYVLGDIPIHEFDEKLKELFAPMLLVLLVIVVLIGFTVWFIVRRNLKPLKGLHEGIHKVENGDFSVEVEIKTNDEIGLLTKGFNHMITQIRAMMKTIEGAANEVKTASTSMVVGTEENAKAITETSVTMERIANGANKQAELVEDNSKK